MTVLVNLYALLVVGLLGAAGCGLLLRLIRRCRGQGTLFSGEWHHLPPGRELGMVFALALMTRIFVLVWSFFLLNAMGEGSGQFMKDFSRLWIHWDARHYLGIASEGYTAIGEGRLRLVFFPLYPLLTRAAGQVMGNVLLGGTLLSVLSGAGAAVLLYILAENVLHGEAVLAVLFFLLNPFSLFLCCAYSEGLFLFLTLAAYLLRRFGHPWLYALAGGLASFTRMPGVLLSGIELIALMEDGFTGRLTPGRLLAGILRMGLVFSGLFLYWGVNARVAGDPFMYLKYQRENWYQEAGNVWYSAGNTLTYFLNTAGEETHWWTWGVQAVCMVLAGLCLLAGQDLPFDLLAYSFVYILVVFSPTWLLSAPRYLFGMFTLPLLQVRMAGHFPEWGTAAALGLSGVFLLLYVYGYTLIAAVF